jgi:protein TonB
VVSSRNGEEAVAQAQARPTPEQPEPDAPLSAREQRDAEMARLAAEVHLRSAQYAKRPNRKFVSASTREYAYANYLRAWVDRAERVGNLNYPDEAGSAARRPGGDQRGRAPRWQRGEQPDPAFERDAVAG